MNDGLNLVSNVSVDLVPGTLTFIWALPGDASCNSFLETTSSLLKLVQAPKFIVVLNWFNDFLPCYIATKDKWKVKYELK